MPIEDTPQEAPIDPVTDEAKRTPREPGDPPRSDPAKVIQSLVDPDYADEAEESRASQARADGAEGRE